jgi:hypothetical protein
MAVHIQLLQIWNSTRWAKSSHASVQEQYCTVLEVQKSHTQNNSGGTRQGVTSNAYCMGAQPFYGKGSHLLLWGGSLRLHVEK